ncbi:unnamed protein product [Owenia fusiformis]|uniref:Ion transport domain-containing protein n=1 Tax=Owenia fusiformis TaxID=6347 RepID=A0A8S4MYF3_OWEFU|nr:unnamed protein product [Owenia fusiformis]
MFHVQMMTRTFKKKLHHKQDKRMTESNSGIFTRSGLLGKILGRQSVGNMEKERVVVKTMDISLSPGDETVGEICRIEESPLRILRMAANGNIGEFERIFYADENRLQIVDHKMWTALHHAASKSRLEIMDFILTHGGDINAADKSGMTPLHIAVEKEQIDAIQFLLLRKADWRHFNKDKLTPLHIAVDLDKPDCVTAILKDDIVDVNVGGEHGQTPLHLAAYKDLSDCAKILLDHGALMCKPCDIGFYPFHIACMNKAHKTIELMIEAGEKLGYRRNEMMSFMDKSRNRPLHSAVNGGDIEAVKICLNAGAQIDALQDDGSNPIHLACSQGSLEMIKVMFEKYPDSVGHVIRQKDVLMMTPLHIAALVDNPEIATHLIENGASVHAKDKEGRTPLLLAASKCSWKTVDVLLNFKSCLGLKDDNQRNFLHLAIMNGAKVEMFRFERLEAIECAKDLLDAKDVSGCSPLHYASKEGHLAAIAELIKLGALLNCKNNERQSPLHFAAKYGRYNTIRRLLDSIQGSNLINETDGDGLTALHIASMNGHTKVIQLLIQKGAVLQRDNKGNSPLHLAAQNGYTQSIRLLLSVHTHLLNACNKDADSALHLAAAEGQTSTVTLLMTIGAEFTENINGMTFFDLAIQNTYKDVALAIVTNDRWQEAMDLMTSKYGCPMLGLIEHLPDVCLAVLDRCRTTSGHEPSHKCFHHKFEFKYLQAPVETVVALKKKGVEILPMIALNMMVRFNRIECLSHPVSVQFLQMKWQSYGCVIHMMNIILYIIFLGCLTNFIVSSNDPMGHKDEYKRINGTEVPTNVWEKHEYSVSQLVPASILAAFCLANIIKEFFQMFQQGFKYFIDVTNYIEWILYTTSAVFVVPSLLGFSTHWQWECGAIAIFLAWFNFLLFLQRFDFFGIYVVMFLEILKTLLQVLIVFSILIIAFAMAFYILLSGEATHAFKNPGLSLMKTTIMMLGEIDYISQFVQPYTDGDDMTLHFGGLTFALLVVFVLLMPILLMNLLIGLAVGDIEQVQRNARLKRLAKQVELHTDMEKKLPKRILKHVEKNEMKVYPNCNKYIFTWLSYKLIHAQNGSLGDDNAMGGQAAHQTYVYQELYKHKRRLKDVTSTLEKQYELLRLIVQKMEIHTEADYRDEGDSGECWNTDKTSSWGTPSTRRTILQKAHAVRKWRRITDSS